MNADQWLKLMQILAPILAPVLVAVLKQFVDAIPKPAIPVIATAVGAGIATLGGANHETALALGASGVAVREFVDQVRKARAAAGAPAAE